MPRKPEERSILAGKRLVFARKYCNYSSREKLLDDKRSDKGLGVFDESTIKAWENKGIPMGKVSTVGDFFELPGYFFSDSRISEENFRIALEKRRENRDADLSFAESGLSPQTPPLPVNKTPGGPGESNDGFTNRDTAGKFSYLSNAPATPQPFVGRVEELEKVKSCLIDAAANHVVVHGLPGVGKTTLATFLAHDKQIKDAFPDGILWSSLDQKPDVRKKVIGWGKMLRNNDVIRSTTKEDAVANMIQAVFSKQLLFIIDDVWTNEDAMPFLKMAGAKASVLFTTRLQGVANELSMTVDNIYELPVFQEKDAVALFKTIAPAVYSDNENLCRELLFDLGYLPLAIIVAGRMLRQEQRLGLGIDQLLNDIRKGAKLLEEAPPANMAAIIDETKTTSVAALLEKSVDILDPRLRMHFIFLGAMAPVPATFDLNMLSALWRVDDPKPIVSDLVDFGLVQPLGSGRFQIHALLVSLAKSFLTRKN